MGIFDEVPFSVGILGIFLTSLAFDFQMIFDGIFLEFLCGISRWGFFRESHSRWGFWDIPTELGGD